MKSFKQYLIETPQHSWYVSWQQHVIEAFIDNSSPLNFFVLLHPALIHKYCGEQNITAYHFCNLNELKRLIQIQNSHKSISATTNFGKEYRERYSGDGKYYENEDNNQCVVRVNGKLMFAGNKDVGSTPEKRGIRGVTIEIYNEVLSDKFRRLRKKLLKEGFATLSNKQLLMYYADYYSLLKELFKNFPEVINTVRDKEYYEKTKHEFAYNELIVSTFTIEQVCLLPEIDIPYREIEHMGLSPSIFSYANNLTDVQNFVKGN